MQAATADPDETQEHPVYWYVVFLEALNDGDFERVVEAQRQLRRLGFRVQYSPPKQDKEVQHAH